MATQEKKLRWVVLLKDNGVRLLSFLRAKLPERYSTKQLKRAIDSKACFVNGKMELISTRRLKTTDQVLFYLNRLNNLPNKKIPISPPLFEDKEVYVINKPSGLISDVDTIRDHLGKGTPPLFLVHRLDKETSGALILAKTLVAKRELEKAFKERRVAKCYLAIVDGVVSRLKGKIDQSLVRKKSYEGQVMWGVTTSKEGLSASTSYELMASDQELSLLKVFPKTGRTHQIRVHLNAIKHPILGDYHYGRSFKSNRVVKRHMLHAYSLSFPLRGKIIEVVAPIPSDMEEVIQSVYAVSHC